MSFDLDVAGIGSMVVDHVHRVPRIAAPGEKVVIDSTTRCPGGVTLNHLAWASILGARTGVFGHVGDDEGGRFLREAAESCGVVTHLVADGSAPSSEAHVFVAEGGERAIYMARGVTADATPERIRDHHAEFLRRARIVSTEVSQLPLPVVREVLRLARENGATTVLDLDVPPSDAVPLLGTREELDEILRLADVIKPTLPAAREVV